MPLPAHQIYKVFANVSANANGNPVLSADFKTILFTLVAAALSNYKIFVYKSDQELPPDISLAQSSTNDYSQLGYTDQSDDTLYGPGGEFNPNGAVDKSFNIETTGARWIIIAVKNYTAGTVQKLDVNLFSNFV